MAIKEIPNNPEAEQAVIGSMFLEKNALQKACEVLNPEAFYFNNNAKIFGTIKDMAEKKVPIDLTTVTTELKNKNILGGISNGSRSNYSRICYRIDSVVIRCLGVFKV